MIKKPVIAFLLDKKGGAIEVSYEELNTVDKNGKILEKLDIETVEKTLIQLQKKGIKSVHDKEGESFSITGFNDLDF